MHTTTRGLAVAATVLGLALAGCGSDTKTDTAAKESTSSTSATSKTSEASSTSAAPSSTANASGPNYTIMDYVKDNKIAETPVKRGDPGTPTVNLPIPEGWADAGAKAPDWAWGQIVLAGTPAGPVPPTITAIMSKLTGADPAKIVEYAPNELKNLPEYEGGNEGQTGKLGGFDAVQVGGTYVKDGQKLLIAQKTVLIPAGQDLFVLQLNAQGSEEDMGPLMDATTAIDDQTTITP
ncbi:LpqN/LpqT family lipoprotein [Mycolicibacterium fluoranthenivorans]|uniref:LpqN/LpqT family lipoprotein n=2 Tax=Mycolicibacterium fluoranthenivorans TaxID=258505 RepID=A0A7G8PPX6_9MYCO|nr:LpqN/LpqT family lipoprotein [Mycolicibacterium fluoranthenivorans]QNJ96392.1 LpqN/LpqT family lipoprotein [Mycolicibacterium fluoranthenivorans]